MTHRLPNRAESLEALSAIDPTELPPLIRNRLRASIDSLRLNHAEQGAYIPRDPEVSILLSYITSGRRVQAALASIAAAQTPHPFPRDKAPRFTICLRARLVIVGDWGSGISRAIDVASQMRRSVDDGLRENREVHVVSLGDVYYSGLGFEYEERFLTYWPVQLLEAGTVHSWALNGNHDMYAGGRGFFGTLLGDPRFHGQARSSCFALENEHWQIAALDTAYAPLDESGSHGSLYGGQADWLLQLRDTGKRTMLMSHHPLLSAFDSTGTILRDALEPVLAQRPVDAWFWGHEHRCAVYRDEHGPIQFAGLLGHGGIPMPSEVHPDNRKAPLVYHYCEGFEPGLSRCGFAQIDLDGAQGIVRFFDERGECHNTASV